MTQVGRHTFIAEFHFSEPDAAAHYFALENDCIHFQKNVLRLKMPLNG